MVAFRVIIDTDIALGSLFKDVDDGFALAYALLNKNFEVLGITTVSGNTTAYNALKLSKKLLRKMGISDIPIYLGALGSHMLGKRTPASAFISQMANMYKDLIIVGIGPTTNIATALLENLIVAERKIILMGGAIFHPGNIPLIRGAEFNFFRDPIATDTLLSFAYDLSIVPLDVTTKVIFTLNDLRKLSMLRNNIAKYFLKSIKLWFYLNYPIFRGFPLHDYLAVLLCEYSSYFTLRRIPLRCENKLNLKGKLTIDRKRRPVNVALNIENIEFLKERWFDVLQNF